MTKLICSNLFGYSTFCDLNNFIRQLFLRFIAFKHAFLFQYPFNNWERVFNWIVVWRIGRKKLKSAAVAFD